MLYRLSYKYYGQKNVADFSSLTQAKNWAEVKRQQGCTDIRIKPIASLVSHTR